MLQPESVCQLKRACCNEAALSFLEEGFGVLEP